MALRGDGQIRPTIRAKLDTHELPAEVPEAVRSGFGRGDVCHACDEAIGPEAIEQVIELVDGRVFPLDASGYRVWRSEVKRRRVKV